MAKIDYNKKNLYGVPKYLGSQKPSGSTSSGGGGSSSSSGSSNTPTVTGSRVVYTQDGSTPIYKETYYSNGKIGYEDLQKNTSGYSGRPISTDEVKTLQTGTEINRLIGEVEKSKTSQGGKFTSELEFRNALNLYSVQNEGKLQNFGTSLESSITKSKNPVFNNRNILNETFKYISFQQPTYKENLKGNTIIGTKEEIKAFKEYEQNEINKNKWAFTSDKFLEVENNPTKNLKPSEIEILNLRNIGYPEKTFNLPDEKGFIQTWENPIYKPKQTKTNFFKKTQMYGLSAVIQFAKEGDPLNFNFKKPISSTAKIAYSPFKFGDTMVSYPLNVDYKGTTINDKLNQISFNLDEKSLKNGGSFKWSVGSGLFEAGKDTINKPVTNFFIFKGLGKVIKYAPKTFAFGTAGLSVGKAYYNKIKENIPLKVSFGKDIGSMSFYSLASTNPKQLYFNRVIKKAIKQQNQDYNLIDYGKIEIKSKYKYNTESKTIINGNEAKINPSDPKLDYTKFIGKNQVSKGKTQLLINKIFEIPTNIYKFAGSKYPSILELNKGKTKFTQNINFFKRYKVVTETTDEGTISKIFSTKGKIIYSRKTNNKQSNLINLLDKTKSDKYTYTKDNSYTINALKKEDTNFFNFGEKQTLSKEGRKTFMSYIFNTEIKRDLRSNPIKPKTNIEGNLNLEFSNNKKPKLNIISGKMDVIPERVKFVKMSEMNKETNLLNINENKFNRQIPSKYILNDVSRLSTEGKLLIKSDKNIFNSYQYNYYKIKDNIFGTKLFNTLKFMLKNKRASSGLTIQKPTTVYKNIPVMENPTIANDLNLNLRQSLTPKSKLTIIPQLNYKNANIQEKPILNLYPKLKTNPKETPFTKIYQNQHTYEKQNLNLQPQTQLKMNLILETNQNTKQTPKTSTKQQIKQIQQTEQININPKTIIPIINPKQLNKKIPNLKIPIIKIPPPIDLPDFTKKRKSTQIQKGFKVFGIYGKKEKLISNKVYTFSTGEQFGKQFTDFRKLTKFKLKQTNQPITEFQDINNPSLNKKFTKKKGIYEEKKKYQRDLFGENILKNKNVMVKMF